MANYDPPTENLPIFDKDVFNTDDTALTIGYANKHYLKYPNAQGTENFSAIVVNGSASFNALSAPTSAQTLLPSNENSNKIPTTAWVQSILTNAGSTYSRIYTTSQTITTPTNCRSIDLFLQAPGGACGTSDGTYYGGSGAGGNTCCINGMPMSEGQSLTLGISSSTFVQYNAITIAQALAGNNGANSAIGINAAGGTSNTTTGVLDTTIGAFYTTFGNAGAPSSGGGIIPPSMTGTLGCPKGVSSWINGGYGMGQQEPFGLFGPGYILITYHLGV